MTGRRAPAPRAPKVHARLTGKNTCPEQAIPSRRDPFLLGPAPLAQKYYYNATSGETSWERPAQYIKGSTQPHTPWWADTARVWWNGPAGPLR